VILNTGLTGLFPLLPLTEGGKTPEVLDTMIEALVAIEEKDLLVFAYTLASLVFKSEEDKKMLKRRFAMLGEILRDTWAYQEIMQEGREEGIQEGLEKGLLALRQILVGVIQASFPELVSFAGEKAERIKDTKVLQDVTLKLLAAKKIEEARRILDEVATEPE
jgi:predicted transposase YdaD